RQHRAECRKVLFFFKNKVVLARTCPRGFAHFLCVCVLLFQNAAVTPAAQNSSGKKEKAEKQRIEAKDGPRPAAVVIHVGQQPKEFRRYPSVDLVSMKFVERHLQGRAFVLGVNIDGYPGYAVYVDRDRSAKDLPKNTSAMALCRYSAVMTLAGTV